MWNLLNSSSRRSKPLIILGGRTHLEVGYLVSSVLPISPTQVTQHRAVGHPSRAFLYISSMLLVWADSFKTWSFSPLGEMVREKGRKPGGRRRKSLAELPGAWWGREWVWASLLHSEALPAPGNAAAVSENPPWGRPVKTTKNINQTLWGYFKAKGKVDEKGGGQEWELDPPPSIPAPRASVHSSLLPPHASPFPSASTVLEPGSPPLFSRWTALSLPCLRRGLWGLSCVSLHCVLNLAGAGASHSKSNYHLSERRAGPGIHGLGRALYTTTDRWKWILSFSTTRARPATGHDWEGKKQAFGAEGHPPADLSEEPGGSVGSKSGVSFPARSSSSPSESSVALDK